MAYAKCSIVLSLLGIEDIRDIRRLQAEDARKLLALYPVNAKKQKQLAGLSGLQVIKANKNITFLHSVLKASKITSKNLHHSLSGTYKWNLRTLTHSKV